MESFESTIQKLRENGFKLTPQRLAVVRYLLGNTMHPKAETIHVDLKRKYPSLSFSTVYNTLNTLASINEIQALHIFDDHLIYDPNTSPHIHFLCRSCEQIIDIDLKGTDMISIPVTEIDGHRVESYQVIFRGTCKDCSQGG
ncbi:MAG: transcriptional repressor [Candidatus Krumholzibacteriota bacterium]|nr:transcriptional repressor [Candidatus Krumholzibacteriota bacterium]